MAEEVYQTLFRHTFQAAGYRKFEPVDGVNASRDTWALATKAALEMGPEIDITDPKKLLAACSNDPFSVLNRKQITQQGEPPRYLSKISPDVAATYFFAKLGASVSVEEATKLQSLTIEQLSLHALFHSSSVVTHNSICAVLGDGNDSSNAATSRTDF